MEFKPIISSREATPIILERNTQKRVSKHKPPSKQKRDLLRSIIYKQKRSLLNKSNNSNNKLISQKQVEMQTEQSRVLEGVRNNGKNMRQNIWSKIKKTYKKNLTKSASVSDAAESKIIQLRGPVHDVPSGDEIMELNPQRTYNKIELNMKLCRLEEERNLLIALRHLVRLLHEGGRQIAFPLPEAVDKIQLRCSNLPTEPQELMNLLTQVFERRNETLNLNETYRDFMRSYGRVILDPKQQWPHCHSLVKYP